MPKGRRIILLSDARGLSATNHLIDSMLAAIMRVHVTLVEQLEKRKQPIGHMAARWISKYHRELDMCFISGCGNHFSYPSIYGDARGFYNDPQGGNEPAAVTAVDTLGKNFASALVSSSKARLEKYWSMLLALQLADPSQQLPEGPGADDTWANAKLLCERTGIDFSTFRDEARGIHIAYSHFAGDDRLNCKTNLLRFYHTLHKEGRCQWLTVRKYAAAVFTFPVTTVFVECLFSGMNLNKSKMRSSMLGGTVVAVLKAKELTQVFGGDYNGSKEKAPVIDFQQSLDDNLPF